MMRLLDFASKLSGCLAGVCAILAVLATPSSAWADDLTDCQNCCAQTYTWGSIEWNECASQCMQGGGQCGILLCNTYCAVVCGPANGGPGTAFPCGGNCTGTGCHFGCGCSQVVGCNECG